MTADGLLSFSQELPLVPKLRLGTLAAEAPLREHTAKFSSIGGTIHTVNYKVSLPVREAELRYTAFPSGAWERGMRYESDGACRLADAVAASDDEFGMIAAFHEQGDEDLKFRGFLNADAV